MSNIGWVLGVDQAARSGWCIMRDGERFASGVASNAIQRRTVVQLLFNLHEVFPGKSMPFVAIEGHNYGPPKAMKSLAATRGRWLEHLELSGKLFTLVEYQPSQWRKAIGCPLNGDEAKLWCKDRYQLSDSDRAEACGIAEATYHLGVIRKQPVRRRRARR